MCADEIVKSGVVRMQSESDRNSVVFVRKFESLDEVQASQKLSLAEICMKTKTPREGFCAKI